MYVRQEKCLELGVKFLENTLSSVWFADDFVGVAETRSALKRLIDIVHNHSKRWRLEANVKKRVVLNFF